MIISLFREISRSVGESISFAVVFPRSQEDLEVILGDFLGPSSLLARAESLCGEGLQVIIICKYHK